MAETVQIYMSSIRIRRSHTPSMPHVLEAPETLFRHSTIRTDVRMWCEKNLKELWVSVYDHTRGDHQIEFASEVEMLFFKMRWIGSPDG